MGQNPFYGTVHNPAAPGRTTGGSSCGQRGGARRRACATSGSARTPAARSGCPRRAARSVGLKPRWGPIPMDGVFPLCPTLDTRRADGAERRGRGARLVGARGPAPVPEPRLEGLTVGLLRQPPVVGDGRPDRDERPGRGAGRPTSSGSARASSRRAVPEPSANTWPLFNHEALQSHRGHVPGPRRRVLATCADEARDRAADDGGRGRRRPTAALEEWRRYEPEVDLYVAPATRASCRPRTPTSSRCGCASPSSCAGST